LATFTAIEELSNRMTNQDPSFTPEGNLEEAISLLRNPPEKTADLPRECPDIGLGESATLELLSSHVIGDAAKLDAPDALANMDPPTPWITWAIALWNARLNQNLLHPATAPFAIQAEQRVFEWLMPFFGMRGGHMCSGSTLANLTAIWAARDGKDVQRIVVSQAAHLSIQKAARMLRLQVEEVPTNRYGQLDASKLGDISDACLVLTAGTTATGEVDPLELIGKARWTHVDAAWGGPLRLSPVHANRLSGIEGADSVAVSAHKLLMQPKDSALVMFRDPDLANSAISFGGGYLTTPNIGVQGSRGAAAISLLATLLALGRTGIVERIDRVMEMANQLGKYLQAEEAIELLSMPKTGVTVFRPQKLDTEELHARLPSGMFSICLIEEEYWLRSVAANPLADIDLIVAAIKGAVRR
jgi:glutamate/tyrosine decarboxylase-like PLP-dependent enzyme